MLAKTYAIRLSLLCTAHVQEQAFVPSDTPSASSSHHPQLQGLIPSPGREQATDQELVEAWFLHMQQELRGTPKAAASQLHMKYMRWVLEGLPPGEALCQRGLLYIHARCYLQVLLVGSILGHAPALLE